MYRITLQVISTKFQIHYKCDRLGSGSLTQTLPSINIQITKLYCMNLHIVFRINTIKFSLVVIISKYYVTITCRIVRYAGRFCNN